MRSPIDQLLDGVEWTPNSGAPPADSSVPYATHEGVLRIGDVELRCFRLNDGRAVFAKEGIDALFGGNVEQLLADIEDARSLANDIHNAITLLHQEKMAEDPKPWEPAHPSGVATPSIVQAVLTQVLAGYGNAKAVDVSVELNLATKTMTYKFYNARTRAELTTVGEILEALRP